jgi:hypothetical protein
MHKMPSHLIPDIGNVVPQNQVLPTKSILDNILRVYKQIWRCIDGTKQETWFAAEDMLGIQTESHGRDGKQRQESSDRNSPG